MNASFPLRMLAFSLCEIAFLACGAPATPADAGQPDAAAITDSGSVDSGMSDAGALDSGFTDAGNADAGPVDSGTVDAGVFTFNCPALADGGTFPVRYTCTDTATNGLVSPAFTWTPATGARSYALVMTDTSINLIHWVLWDIAPSEIGLAEGVSNVASPPLPSGSKQTKSYDNSTFGYRGPCPPAVHTYTFVLSALDVAQLPGVTSASSRAQVTAAMASHVVDSRVVTGIYGP